MNPITPVFEKNNIAICFSTDNNFVPYLAVVMQSLVHNISQFNNYDIVILEENLTDFHKKDFFKYSRENVSIRFINMTSYMESYKDVWYIHNWGKKWHSLSVYYRFFIPEIFKEYQKVVFLDGDIIINIDIAELYNVDLKENLVGAVQDFARNIKNDAIAEYSEKVLDVDRKKYFNAGVLVFNLKKLTKIKFLDNCIKTLQEIGRPKLQDQDILNIVLKDQVLYLNNAYNCLFWSILHGRSNAKELLDSELYSLWEEMAKNPKIFHYAGSRKPWSEPNLEYATYFWSYARQTPFYEEILGRMIDFKISQRQNQNIFQNYPSMFFLNAKKIIYKIKKLFSKGEFSILRAILCF